MNQTIHFTEPAKLTCHLYISDSCVLNLFGKVPSRFHRWMMGKAFGWRFVVVP